MVARSARSAAALSIDELLARSAWYAQLDDSVRAQVRPTVIERIVLAGAELSHHGGTAIYWYGVLQGVLKWSTTARDGRSATLGGLTTGSWFGEGSLLHGRPVAADIIALRDSRVAMVPKDVFDWLYSTQLGFNHFLLKQINERLHWFMGDFEAQRLFTAEAQVARALVGLLHPTLNPVGDPHLDISQEELSSLAGLSRQRCNQAISRLKADGLVAVEYGGIMVVDPPGLARVAAA